MIATKAPLGLSEDNLTSAATNRPLSANQGRILNEKIATIAGYCEGKVVSLRPHTLMRLRESFRRICPDGSLTDDVVDKGRECNFVARFMFGGREYYVTEWARPNGNRGIPRDLLEVVKK
jgi:hypothetical protein